MALVTDMAQLKVAIETMDWESVCEVYENLTGDQIGVPKIEVGFEFDVENVRLQINQVLDLYKKNMIPVVVSSKVKMNKPPKVKPLVEKKRGRPKKVEVVPETEVDESSFLGQSDEKLKEESRELAKKVGRKVPRPIFKEVEVECDKCHKKEKVHPILAPKKIGDEYARYVCNKCNGGRR